MSVDQIIPLIIFFVIFLICFFAIRIRKRKYKLNELQIKAQNSAYKAAFLFYLSYNILIFILNVLDIQIASFEMQIIIGIFITSIIFIGVCVFKDAFIPPNKYGNLNLVFIGGTSIIYSFYKIITCTQADVNFIEQGRLIDDIVYPLIGVWGLSLLLIFLINLIINQNHPLNGWFAQPL